MEDNKSRIIKRIDSQYKASFWTGIGLFILSIIIAIVTGGFSFIAIGVAGFFGIVILIIVLPTMLKYKKAMNTIENSTPSICSVTRADLKFISSKRVHQAAFFMYEDKEHFGLDFEKELEDILPGQQLYVWKITDKYYEISHIE